MFTFRPTAIRRDRRASGATVNATAIATAVIAGNDPSDESLWSNTLKPKYFAGKNIGNWGYGNEFEIFAALTKAGLDPAADVTLVQQQFEAGHLQRQGPARRHPVAGLTDGLLLAAPEAEPPAGFELRALAGFDALLCPSKA